MSIWTRVGRRLRDATTQLRDNVDADVALQASMAACIELAATRYALREPTYWTPGEPLKLLFVGYAGTRNTGADVRVEEMIRQFRHILTDELAELSILTIAPEWTRGYFPTTRQLHMPKLFPKFLTEQVHEVHGVVACEGSMFKSKFANALSTLMVGGLGLATAEGKLAIAYGGEAGKMDESLRELVRRYCKHALIIARNHESREVLAELSIGSKSGTDTAWTYDPGEPERGAQLLREAGWDGTTPVIALCPINPFWWPVKPDVFRAMVHAMTGSQGRAHYASVYFHHLDDDVDDQQERYVSQIAEAVNALRAERDVFPICVGMEMLDRGACQALSDKLGGAPLFISDDYEHRDMVRVLRSCSAVVSSRYHALVCSMPGLVPSAGITMDERIRNLMIDRGTPELALEVDDPELAQNLLPVLRRLLDERDELSEGIGRTVVANLERQGRMGMDLVDYLLERHPELPLDPKLGGRGDPWDHLPPLTGAPAQVVARYRE